MNGIEIGAMTDVLTGLDFDKGDTVACVATPNDGDDDGIAVASEVVTIGNTAPTLAAAAISPDPAIETDTLACAYSGFEDADGDGDESLIAWSINGLDAGTGPENSRSRRRTS